MEFLNWKPAAEFIDRTGITRPVYLCSLVGRDEFFDRLSEMAGRLAEAAETGETWQEFYCRDGRTRYLAHRCLELCGIQPEWVSLPLLGELLIGEESEGIPRPGWLVRLNQPQGKATSRHETKLSEVIAAISTVTGSVSEALNLVATVPAPLLLEVVEERMLMQLPPEERRKRQFAQRLPEIRADLEAALKLSDEDLKEL